MKHIRYFIVVLILIIIGIISYLGVGQSWTRIYSWNEEMYKEIAWNEIKVRYPNYSKLVSMNRDDFFSQNLDQKYEFSYLGDKTYIVFDEYWKYSEIHTLHKDYQATVHVSGNDSIDVSNLDLNLILIEFELYWEGIPHNLNVILDIEERKFIGILGIM